jgi:cell wall-associated NlpC family hydrolase
VKIAIGAAACVVILIMSIVAAITAVASTVLGGGPTNQPSPTALADIPTNYLALYQAAAATCPGLSWTILAAIGKIETNDGRSTLPGVHSGSNSAGAAGVMQFEPATFAAYDQPIPPGGVAPASPYDPADAIYAAARLLCANGARNNANINAAIFTYNHADWYVNEVLAQASEYAQATTDPSVDCASIVTGMDQALTAVQFACAQIGKPYIWGGNGTPGFDCSGLTHAAYIAAGVTLPRTAQTQYNAGPLIPAGAPLQIGDLVFYGARPTSVTHVGIAISATQMIDAPHTGADVRIDGVGNYLAASRPAN